MQGIGAAVSATARERDPAAGACSGDQQEPVFEIRYPSAVYLDADFQRSYEDYFGEATSKGGKPYALFNFEAVGTLNPEEAVQVKAFGRQFMEIVNTAQLVPELAEAG